jgi:glycosyltransferase involved in cell wall biosynthesis
VDLLVVPSIVEPWGNVVVEALGLGVPVLATPSVGAAASLSLEFSGIMLASGDRPVPLADALVEARASLASLAQAAVSEAVAIRARFGIDSVVEAMSAVFENRWNAPKTESVGRNLWDANS